MTRENDEAILESFYNQSRLHFPKDIPQELVNVPPLTLSNSQLNTGTYDDDSYIWICNQLGFEPFPRKVNKSQDARLCQAVEDADIQVVPYLLKDSSVDLRDCKVFRDDSGGDWDPDTFPAISMEVSFQLTNYDHTKQLDWPSSSFLGSLLEEKLADQMNQDQVQKILNEVIKSKVPEWESKSFVTSSRNIIINKKNEEMDLSGTIAGINFTKDLPSDERTGIFTSATVSFHLG